MKILFNGDSNMCGEELEDRSLGIAPQLCRLLQSQGENLSLTGASNDRIYDTTMNYVKNNPAPDLIVIGWSEHARVQWFMTDQGGPEWIEINNLSVGSREPPAEYRMRLQHWYQTADNFDYRVGLSHYWHQKIYNLHKYLQYLKIPHVFFNAFHDFRVENPEFQLDWSNNFVNPYSVHNTYVNWCDQQGHKQITPGWYHYGPAAQLAWAEKLHAHINQYCVT